MKLSNHGPRATRSRTNSTSRSFAVLLVLCLSGGLLMLVGGAAGAVTAVPLGTSGSFAVLAGAGITNTGPTTINGDMGTFPTIAESGTGSITLTGTDHDADAVTQQAQNDLTTGYNTAAGEGPTSPIGPGSAIVDLGGQTLTPGVYNSSSSIGLTGALTLDGGGDPNAVFVFQAGSTLTTASASQINLINGAQSCNVFWQVGSSATLGTGSSFRGSILALTSITVTTDVTVDGRVLALNGAVTLDTDTITAPSCAAAVTTTADTTTSGDTSTAATTTAATTTAATTTAGTTTTAAPPATTTTPAASVLPLANFSTLTAATVKAAEAAKAAVVKASHAKVVAVKAAAKAKVAKAKTTAAASRTTRLARAKLAARLARTAKSEAAKAAALAKVAAAKLALAKKLASETKLAASSSAHILARPARIHVGLTG